MCLCGKGEDSNGCRALSNFWEELDELSVVFWRKGGGTNTHRMKLAGPAKQTVAVKGCHRRTNRKSDLKNRKGVNRVYPTRYPQPPFYSPPAEVSLSKTLNRRLLAMQTMPTMKLDSLALSGRGGRGGHKQPQSSMQKAGMATNVTYTKEPIGAAGNQELTDPDLLKPPPLYPTPHMDTAMLRIPTPPHQFSYKAPGAAGQK